MTSSNLLYFPPKEFSPRFGDQFFTVIIQGYEIKGHESACGGQYALYHLEVKRGKKRWEIKRRFSDFDRMSHDLLQEIILEQEQISLPRLPPKTCWRTIEQVSKFSFYLIHNISLSFSLSLSL
jgi:hypothetical protein